MQVNMFAMGAMGIGPDHPPIFNVSVGALAPGYASAIKEAIERGSLQHYQDSFGNTWVSHSDLVELAGPGSDTDEPEGGCYIPCQAVITFHYLPE